MKERSQDRKSERNLYNFIITSNVITTRAVDGNCSIHN